MKRTSFTASLMVLAALLAGKSEGGQNGEQPPQQISIQKVYGNDETHTFICGGTNEIKAYGVTLYVEASSSGGKEEGGYGSSGNSGLTGTLDGNPSKTFTLTKSGSNYKGSYKLSNTYNPVDYVTVKKQSMGGEEVKCEINLQNNWRCSQYLTDACKTEVLNSDDLYAAEHGEVVSVTYAITTKFDANYPECNCRSWDVYISGTKYPENCAKSRKSEYTFNRTVELTPNNNSFPKYNHYVNLTTTHEIARNEYEKLSCGSVSFTIKDPPLPPTPLSPNSTVYYIKPGECSKPNFTWGEPEDWGWLGEGVNIPKRYYIEVFNASSAVIKNKDSIENTFISDLDCFSEGEYSWRVSSHPDVKTIPSEVYHFSVCKLELIYVHNIMPNNYDTVGADVMLSWDVLGTIPDCASETDYGYFVTVKYDKTGTITNYTSTYSEAEVQLSNLGEGSYTWEISVYGPNNITLNNETIKKGFTVCIDKPPGTPEAVYIQGQENSNVICSGSENKGLTLAWTATQDSGTVCSSGTPNLAYRVEVSSSESQTYANYSSENTLCEINVPCVKANYNVSLYANNSFAESKPATYKFSVCSQSNPKQPIVDSKPEPGKCRSTTEISWSHDDWGSSCYDNKNKKFKITWTKDGSSDSFEESADFFSTGTENSYVYNVTLSSGTWYVSVQACNSDGLCSELGEGTVEASVFPEIGKTSATNDGENNITFSWDTNSEFLSCENMNDFIYTLEYEINGITRTVNFSVSDAVSYDINYTTEPIYWRVILSSSYDDGTRTEFEQYDVNDDCKLKDPKWPASPLYTPQEDSTVFENVLFSWKKVDSFGSSCKEDTEGETIRYVSDNSNTGYIVAIGESTYKVSKEVTSITKNVTKYGEHTWNVTAYNGNVSSITENRVFCHASNPPAISIKCSDKPYTSTTLSWVLNGEFSETCNKSYGYIFTHDGQPTYKNADETSIELSDNYLGTNYTWSVKSYIDGEYGEEMSCTTNLCKITQPKAPSLEKIGDIKVIDKNGEWTFNWTNGNNYADMCGSDASFSYAVTVINNTGDTIKELTTEDTGVLLKFDEDGTYNVSVKTCDGTTYSSSTDITLVLCIPRQFEEPILESPENNKTILKGELSVSSLKWHIDFSNEQCDEPIKYTLWYWKDNGDPQRKGLSKDDTGFSIRDFESNNTYFWNITIESEYWSVTSEVRNFTICTPDKPSAPVLEQEIRIDSSEYTLTWDDVDWGETCGFKNNTYYYVYFFKKGNDYNSVLPKEVTSPSYTFDDLSDGDYNIAIRAVNNEVEGEFSNYANVSVCVPSKPARPTLWYPQNGDVMPIRNGINFDVVPQLNVGSKCKIKSGSNGNLSGKYQLYVNGAYIGSFNESELNYTNSLSKNIYRFFVNTSFNYWTNYWNVMYVNIDGENRTSDNFVFYGCNKPLPTYDMVPPNNETFEQFDVEITWNINEEDFGYKCTTDSDIRSEQIVILYLEKVNITEVMTNQDLSNPDDINYTLLTPTTSVATIPFGEIQKYKFEDGEVGATYIWRTETFNGYDTTSSDTYMFKITDDFCKIVTCEHGSCSSSLGICLCDEGYSGDTCSHQVPKSKGNSVLGPALGGSLGGFLLIVIIIGLILFILLRKNRRKRVVLEGPGGDIRFSNVKVPAAARDASDEDTAAIEQRVREDCERLQNGASPAEAFVFAQEYRSKIKSNEDIDAPVKAFLYTYYRIGCGRELLKFFITTEVNKAQKPETLFRHNTPATAMFKHWSKIIGLDYLFKSFSDILKGLIQHEVDAANDRKSDVSLQLFNDTCEVDPTRIQDDEDVEQLLAVNALQLSLTVQRFATQIYRSVSNIPYEIKDVCMHIYTTIEAAYPGYGVRGISAFLFLRFYSVSISVPEAYGLLKNPPSEELRRSLVLVTKVLQVMSLGNKFGEKEEYMNQFNTLVDENRDKMNTFYKGLLDKDKPCDGIKPDVKVPSGIAKDSLLLMTYVTNRESKKSDPTQTESEPQQ